MSEGKVTGMIKHRKEAESTHTDPGVTYLCVSIQHFDSFSGDEQVHLCHHLRVFILALGNKRHIVFNMTMTTVTWGKNRMQQLHRVVGK